MVESFTDSKSIAYTFGTIVMSVYGSFQQVSLKIILLWIVSFTPIIAMVLYVLLKIAGPVFEVTALEAAMPSWD